MHEIADGLVEVLGGVVLDKAGDCTGDRIPIMGNDDLIRPASAGITQTLRPQSFRSPVANSIIPVKPVQGKGPAQLANAIDLAVLHQFQIDPTHRLGQWPLGSSYPGQLAVDNPHAPGFHPVQQCQRPAIDFGRQQGNAPFTAPVFDLGY